MNKKEYRASLKNMNEEGTGTAVFATLNVIDKDGDVLLPGILDGEPKTVKLMGAHDWSAPNIGMATIKENGNELVADFKFYLDMQSAAEWYKSVKNNFDNGVDQELSFGFEVKDSERGKFEEKNVRFLKKTKVFETSFVTRGAGENTRVTAIKSADEDDTEQKHLTLAEEGERVLLAVDGYVDRSKALAALRSKEGRTLSSATRTRLTSLRPRLTEALNELDSLLNEADRAPEPTEAPTQEMGPLPEAGKSIDADAMYAEFLAIQARLAGHLH